jgi:hypothetical protein
LHTHDDDDDDDDARARVLFQTDIFQTTLCFSSMKQLSKKYIETNI